MFFSFSDLKWLAGFCALIFCQNNVAATVDDSDVELQWFYQHASALQSKLIEHAKQTGKRHHLAIFKETVVLIDDQMTLPAIAFATHDGPREIRVSGEFVRALQQHSPQISRLILAKSQVQALTQQQLPQDELHQLLQQLAIEDVLLHEFGHHIENAFYGGRASPYRIHMAETIAENWSLKTKSELNIDDENIGKLVAISAAVLSTPDEHDHAMAQLKHHFSLTCYTTYSQTAADFCGSFTQSNLDN